MPRPMAPSALCALLLATTACAHGATRRGGSAPAQFVARSAANPGAAEAKQLAAWAKGDLHARVVRLDRLLDLFDQARFGPDADARDVFWEALGGHETGRGPDATRDALARLLELALALDGAGVAAADQAIVADAIAMLSADLQGPVSAEDLALRTLAWRSLAESGHPRIRDNAGLRLYDHVRQTLVAASEVEGSARADVAVQALYARQEDLDFALVEAPPAVRAPWIGPQVLIEELHHRRAAIGTAAPWRELSLQLAVADRELARVIAASLPAARDPTLSALARPRGTGSPESLAPILRTESASAVVDHGRPQARRVDISSDSTQLARAIRDALIQDGRGVVLLAVDPATPAPELHHLLRAIRRAQVDRLEFALREPHDDRAIGTVITAIGLWVIDVGHDTAGAGAFTRARIRVHVGGRGAELSVDGARYLEPVAGDALARGLETLGHAYPRETVVAVTIDDDVRVEQIVDALAAIRHAAAGRFAEVGWLSDDARVQGAADSAASRRVEARARLRVNADATTIDQPFPLAGADQQRLATFAGLVPWCLPELESALPPGTVVKVVVELALGRVTSVQALPLPGVKAARVEALRACVQDEAYGLRLREHQDKMTVTIYVAGRAR